MWLFFGVSGTSVRENMLVGFLFTFILAITELSYLRICISFSLTNTYVYFKIGGHNLVYKMRILCRTQLEK